MNNSIQQINKSSKKDFPIIVTTQIIMSIITGAIMIVGLMLAIVTIFRYKYADIIDILLSAILVIIPTYLMYSEISSISHISKAIKLLSVKNDIKTLIKAMQMKILQLLRLNKCVLIDLILFSVLSILDSNTSTLTLVIFLSLPFFIVISFLVKGNAKLLEVMIQLRKQEE